MSTPAEIAVIKICLPEDEKTRTHLDAYALDARSRDVAAKTRITCEGKTLWVSSFKTGEKNGIKTLTITVEEASFKFM